MSILTKMFGTHSERELKLIYPTVDKIEALRPAMMELSDEELRGKTKEFKERLAEGQTLDDILIEAFAAVREAARRVLGMEHYRVQLIGGIILHQGRIAEMKTGEGKTLVSTLPAYLNALEGKGVHVVTVNDYLAHRDAEWMGKVHEALGLTVGVVLNSNTNNERRAAYNCDITYVTNNELGFDYLRDNMVIYKEQLVQRELHNPHQKSACYNRRNNGHENVSQGLDGLLVKGLFCRRCRLGVLLTGRSQTGYGQEFVIYLVDCPCSQNDLKLPGSAEYSLYAVDLLHCLGIAFCIVRQHQTKARSAVGCGNQIFPFPDLFVNRFRRFPVIHNVPLSFLAPWAVFYINRSCLACNLPLYKFIVQTFSPVSPCGQFSLLRI